MEKLPWRTPRLYPLAQQPAGRDADGERTSDEFWREREARRAEESPRRTLEAAWGKLEPLPRDSDITSGLVPVRQIDGLGNHCLPRLTLSDLSQSWQSLAATSADTRTRRVWPTSGKRSSAAIGRGP
jgi:hypothetical protein